MWWWASKCRCWQAVESNFSSSLYFLLHDSFSVPLYSWYNGLHQTQCSAILLGYEMWVVILNKLYCHVAGRWDKLWDRTNSVECKYFLLLASDLHLHTSSDSHGVFIYWIDSSLRYVRWLRVCLRSNGNDNSELVEMTKGT